MFLILYQKAYEYKIKNRSELKNNIITLFMHIFNQIEL